MKEVELNQLRILVVDDEQAILDSYQQVLFPERNPLGSEPEMEALVAKLFGEKRQASSGAVFDLVLCRQGNEAVEAAQIAIEANRPFAVAFIDVRLPPGPDGVWTAEHIRALDPHMEIVMVTAYSDVDPSEIAGRVSPEDKLLYVQKPFHPQEIRQFASALGAKWQTERALRRVHAELEQRVKERTAELKKINQRLEDEIAEHKKAEEALRNREAELKLNSHRLEEVNTALRVLLRQRDEHKVEIEEKVLSNLRELVIPHIETLKTSDLDAKQMGCVNMLESNLKDLISPFSQKLCSEYLGLTPKEIQVANLVREGKTTKEIAELLNVSTNAIVFHRYHIRKKLGLKNQKVNLRSYLSSLP
jgi:DNA-binding NarL/FixJ family response regulator